MDGTRTGGHWDDLRKVAGPRNATTMLTLDVCLCGFSFSEKSTLYDMVEHAQGCSACRSQILMDKLEEL
jgi:hypothetical protein